jgi:predicted glycoside hydrolase/deacetylase ChbG (UPF0249 family)
MTPIEAATQSQRRPVILCADDYAMTAGVSAGIEELASAQRLSATSALVTGPHWREHGPRLRGLRDKIAIGLHFNLTLGAPLSRMNFLAPEGKLPPLAHLLRKSVLGQVNAREIAEELHRQLDAFEDGTGLPPDTIDGHQHVHALPGIRGAVLLALVKRFPQSKPLLRDPSDHLMAIAARGTAVPKAASLALLARGFGLQARRLGFETNAGFSGVSNFDDTVPYAEEIEQGLRRTGPRHMMMSHPGYPDAELKALDPVVDRRRSELEALKGMADLPSLIWHPRRASGSGKIIWGG